jgi:malate/lactate dehydrogenase
MREVGIVGAGELGGAIAHLLARRDLARRVTLVDEAANVAAGKALDIAQAAPVEGFATQLSGAADIATIAGAHIIIVADAVNGGEWQGDAALEVVKRIGASAPRAVIVCAGAHARDLVDRGVRDLKIGRGRLVGTAPEALAAAVRALVALQANVSPRDVALSVLGAPPEHTVIAWEDATIGAFALTRQIDEPTRRRIGARAAALWPPGPHALAAAAVKAAGSIVGRGRQLVGCFVAPEAMAAGWSRATALPVRFDSSGVAGVVMPALSTVERVALENATAL